MDGAAAPLASGLLDDRRTVAGQQSGASPSETIAKAMEGVTPGPWSVEGFDDATGQVNVIGDGFFIAGVIANQPDQEATAAYIAACNPVAISELLALARQAEALQRENAELREALRPFAKVADELTQSKYGPAWGFNNAILEHEDFRRARALLGGENAK